MKNSKEGNSDKLYVQESKISAFQKNAKDLEIIYKTSIDEYNDYLDLYSNQKVFVFH